VKLTQRGTTLIVDFTGDEEPDTIAAGREAARARRLAAIAADHARDPVCPHYGVRMRLCLACGGRGCVHPGSSGAPAVAA
jgi:hypothetical protein